MLLQSLYETSNRIIANFFQYIFFTEQHIGYKYAYSLKLCLEKLSTRTNETLRSILKLSCNFSTFRIIWFKSKYETKKKDDAHLIMF